MGLGACTCTKLDNLIISSSPDGGRDTLSVQHQQGCPVGWRRVAMLDRGDIPKHVFDVLVAETVAELTQT